MYIFLYSIYLKSYTSIFFLQECQKIMKMNLNKIRIIILININNFLHYCFIYYMQILVFIQYSFILKEEIKYRFKDTDITV